MLHQTINVAALNVREFGKVRRTPAAIHFIAEILDRARRGSPAPVAGLDCKDRGRSFAGHERLPDPAPA